MSFTIQKPYNKLLVLQPKVPWGKLILRNKATPRSRFVVWLTALQKFYTKHKLKQLRMAVQTSVMCDNGNESHNHMFMLCPYAIEVRRMVMKNSPMIFLLLICNKK